MLQKPNRIPFYADTFLIVCFKCDCFVGGSSVNNTSPSALKVIWLERSSNSGELKLIWGPPINMAIHLCREGGTERALITTLTPDPRPLASHGSLMHRPQPLSHFCLCLLDRLPEYRQDLLPVFLSPYCNCSGQFYRSHYSREISFHGPHGLSLN